MGAMTFRLPANLPDKLRAAGLSVVELNGWHANGRPASTGSFNPVGTLWHHTGSYDGMHDAKDDRGYAQWLAFTGRSDLPAPLCQMAISAEGKVFMCAGGRANHAGVARASGSVSAGDGNSLYVGTECMNSGSQGWGSDQLDAMHLVAAIVHTEVLHTSVRACRGHKETSVTGKWDPGMLDMDKFRADVAQTIKDFTPGTNLPDPHKRAARLIEGLAREAERPKVKDLLHRAAESVRNG